MRLLILNGPNLNLLGKREPEVYGHTSFEDFFVELKNNFPQVQFDYFQSNIEGELINKLHEVGFSFDGIIFNANLIVVGVCRVKNKNTTLHICCN